MVCGIKLDTVIQGIGTISIRLLRLSWWGFFFFLIFARKKQKNQQRDSQTMVRNESPLMNSIFYPISHIKKPISLKFLVYIKSANHSKAFDMVSMVAQKAMTQFYVWQIRYEIAQCACVYVVVCADGCVHTDEKFSSEQTQSCLLLNFLGFSYTHEHTHSSL